MGFDPIHTNLKKEGLSIAPQVRVRRPLQKLTQFKDLASQNIRRTLSSRIPLHHRARVAMTMNIVHHPPSGVFAWTSTGNSSPTFGVLTIIVALGRLSIPPFKDSSSAILVSCLRRNGPKKSHSLSSSAPSSPPTRFSSLSSSSSTFRLASRLSQSTPTFCLKIFRNMFHAKSKVLPGGARVSTCR